MLVRVKRDLICVKRDLACVKRDLDARYVFHHSRKRTPEPADGVLESLVDGVSFGYVEYISSETVLAVQKQSTGFL